MDMGRRGRVCEKSRKSPAQRAKDLSEEGRKIEKSRSLKQRGAQKLTIPTQEVSAILDHRDPPPHVHAPAVHIVQDHMKQVWRANHHLNQNPRLESKRMAHNRQTQTERETNAKLLLKTTTNQH